MKNSIVVIVLLFLLTSCTNNLNKPKNFNEDFNLQFRQYACPGKDSEPQHRELTNNGNQFFAQLTTHFSCGTVAGNPEIFAKGKSITLAVDSFSPSGMVAACLCSRTLEFNFTIPAELEEYNFELIAFTLNGALIDIVPVEEEYTVRRKQ